jgi:hypothetical protein
MKDLIKGTANSNSIHFFPKAYFSILLFIFFTSCSIKPEPYSIIEFQNGEEVYNYSKSLYLSVNKPAGDSTTVIMGSKGDLFGLADFLYYFQDTSAQKKFSIHSTDSILFVDGKITSINISGKDSVIPWMDNLLQKDLTELQIININTDTIGGCLFDLKKLAAVKPEAGIVFPGDFQKLEPLLQIFQPQLLVSPKIYEKVYGKLVTLTGLKILIASFVDSLMTDPLPAMPSLKHLVLTDIDENAVITANLLINNKQIEKIGLVKEGTIDFALLRPLENLRELVIMGTDSILNPEEINRYNKLELLTLTGEGQFFNFSDIHLPRLRWITVPSCVTQDQFTSLIKNHPGLEVVEISDNDTISSLKPLSSLTKLTGLTVLDTLTDLTTVKTLKNLKYLSLPHKLLKDSLLKADLQAALPDTKIAANDGFCLGSGWLLLLIPLVLVFRFLAVRKNKLKKDILMS